MPNIQTLITNLFHHQQTKDYLVRHLINEVVSGGQTGVDRAALDIAIKYKIKHGGWCPSGRKAEDGIIPSQYQLQEAPAPSAEQSLNQEAIYNIRTELNARDSDGTLIILKTEPIGGTLYTLEMLKKYQKPYFLYNITTHSNMDTLVTWLSENKIQKLNIAGPRASQTLGIYESTYQVLQQMLNQPLPKQQFNTVTEAKPTQPKL